MVEIVKAYVVATVKRGMEHTAAQKIKKMNEVKEVLVTYGLYDLVVRIEAKSLGQMDKIVTDIRQMTEIKQTSTLVGSQRVRSWTCVEKAFILKGSTGIREEKRLNFETSKNLGGVGAILLFIGFIIPVATGSFGLLLSLVGLILVLVGLKGLADYYNDAGIFNNFLYGTITGVAGVVVAVLAVIFAVFTMLSDFIYGIFPTWNGDWTTLPSLTPDISMVVPSDIVPFLTAMLIVLVILFFTAIIVAIFMRKSLNVLSSKTGVGLFGTTGLLLLIGAVLTIVVVGLLLIWIAMLILAIAFFSMRPQPAMSAEAPS
jgi:uncharacterized membrane protein